MPANIVQQYILKLSKVEGEFLDPYVNKDPVLTKKKSSMSFYYIRVTSVIEFKGAELIEYIFTHDFMR